MENVFEILRERGFIRQSTNPTEIARILSEERITYYVGFDATAESFHVGSLVPIMAMVHLQRAGHTPIAIIGGGTTMIGDPSGKTTMRQLLLRETIDANGDGLLSQLKRYLDFGEGIGTFLNNADWLLPLSYIDFLREIGRHFRVNEMIKAEAYRQRLEREEGLSFIEFNYQLLQAYDFLHLFRHHGCVLQLGGDDQWGNILAGVDLVRRLEGRTVHALTFPLLTTANGEKMGKTATGAVWLDTNRTSPYDFYQYWINVDDRDVKRFLACFTLLPMDEVNRLGELKGDSIRKAKEVLAYEVTKLAHGDVEAENARSASRGAFGDGDIDLSAIPTTIVDADRLNGGIPVVDLFNEVGLGGSKSAVRRLIQQGGAYLNGEQINDTNAILTGEHLDRGALLLRHGKKHVHRVVIE
ncbi:MAG: tyrosine--tRNA ligase [Candidatus Poribacteria bacterium]|nr:tyrosine--tRNA ligase [Candidatus Poribacteria bacterium]MDE0502934.1 tyrosine--tRNA ligase [Candidatus Poribacteria bacterium]